MYKDMYDKRTVEVVQLKAEIDSKQEKILQLENKLYLSSLMGTFMYMYSVHHNMYYITCTWIIFACTYNTICIVKHV